MKERKKERGKGTFVLWYLQRGEPCCSTTFQQLPHLSGRYCVVLDRNATPENRKLFQEKKPMEKHFGFLWISLWQVLKGTRADRVINFYCSSEIESAGWYIVIPFLNPFKMDLEEAHCLGLPCLPQWECVAPGLSFDFLWFSQVAEKLTMMLAHSLTWNANYVLVRCFTCCYEWTESWSTHLLQPVAKLEEKESLEWQRTRISDNPGENCCSFSGQSTCCWVVVWEVKPG